MNLLIFGSLSQLLGVINGHQMIIYLTLFQSVKFPANTRTINDAMVKLATFDIIPTAELLDSHIFELPEEEPWSWNFEVFGIDSLQFQTNNSATLWLWALHFFFFLILALLCAINRCKPCNWLKRR